MGISCNIVKRKTPSHFKRYWKGVLQPYTATPVWRYITRINYVWYLKVFSKIHIKFLYLQYQDPCSGTEFQNSVFNFLVKSKNEQGFTCNASVKRSYFLTFVCLFFYFCTNCVQQFTGNRTTSESNFFNVFYLRDESLRFFINLWVVKSDFLQLEAKHNVKFCYARAFRLKSSALLKESYLRHWELCCVIFAFRIWNSNIIFD